MTPQQDHALQQKQAGEQQDVKLLHNEQTRIQSVFMEHPVNSKTQCKPHETQNQDKHPCIHYTIK